MYNIEGEICIPLEDFWEFVKKYHPNLDSSEVRYGVPKVNGPDICIDFAASTDGDPSKWSVKPKAVTQWEKSKQEVPKLTIDDCPF